MNKILIILMLSLILLSGCTYYTGGSCGSLCVSKECRELGTCTNYYSECEKKGKCEWNRLGNLLEPTQKIKEYCLEKCYKENK